MKKMAIILQTGYEDIELISPIDLFKKSEIEYDLISIENLDYVKGKYNAIVKTKHIKDFNYDQYNSIFIPGGAAVSQIIKNEMVLKMINYFYNNNMYIYVICAAPSILGKLNILNDIKHTAFPGYEYKNTFLRLNVVHDKNIISASGPGASINFALEIIKNIKGIKMFNKLYKSMNIY